MSHIVCENPSMFKQIQAEYASIVDGLNLVQKYAKWFYGIPYFNGWKPGDNKHKKKQKKENNETSRSIQIWMSFAFFPSKKRKKWTKCRRYFLWNIFFFPLFTRHCPPCRHNLTASKHALANIYNQKRAKSLRVRVYSRINFTSRASRSGSLYLKKRAR